MSKKYVIDLPDDAQYILINGASENHCYTRIEQVDDLEELNSDYINENFGELQDEAYRKGFEDGKKSTEKGCGGCKYEWYGDTEDPCWHCRRCYKDKYEPTLHSDRIEVGDEVRTRDGAPSHTFLVTKATDSHVYGISDDGSWNCWTKDEVTKTGKHCDIASILEAMRTHD